MPDFSHPLNRLLIKNILTMEATDQTDIQICGWIRTKREAKSVSFLELNDGSCLANLQVVCDEQMPANLIKELNTGSCVAVWGKLSPSPGKDQSLELKAEKISLLGNAAGDAYPLQKKRHSFEFLREIAHLRPRTNTFGAIARVRNTLSYAIHRFFQENNYLYVHTPIITGSDCEGAGQMFQVTTLENLRQADYTEDFFGKKTHLTVSGQLEAEIYASAFGRVYTFGPTFRAEHSNTTRHLAEFWMIEPETAFCDLAGNMNLAEAFIKYIFTALLNERQQDMEFFDRWVENGLLDNITHILNSDFTPMTYSEAVGYLEKAAKGFTYPVHWGLDLQAEHERYLTEKLVKGPLIITDYPKEIKAFYMKQNEDGKTVKAMDVLFPRLGEIIGGSEREADLERLQDRIRGLNLDENEYWWYLELRKFGSAPHAGFGLGFERLIQFVSGMKNIRDVIPFPRAYKEAEF